MVEGVATFKYLGKPIDQTNDDWTAVRRNIMRTISFWGRLETLLRWEGVEPMMLEMFYKAVAQVVLIFGYETWVISGAMERRV